MRQVSQDQKDAHRYDDLLDLPHPVSKNHRPMPRLDRAAQFAPFAALTGYDESIQDAARKPEAREERSESEMEELNAKIQLLSAQIKSHPEIVIRYYQTETEKEHTKVLRKDGVIMNASVKRQQMQAMAKEAQIRQQAKGPSAVMGYYVTERKACKRINVNQQTLQCMDGTIISFADIASIDGEMFEEGWEE